MKELLKNSRVCGYLEKIFRQLNEDKFSGELETPIITIQSTPRAYGHITVGKVWGNAHGGMQYELNIGAGTLNRPIENVVSTMLHEMVHLYNLMHDIQDTSRGGTYHNKKFKDKAESVGLIIEYDSHIGWSVTSPSESLIDYVLEKDWTDVLINRNESCRISIGGNSGSLNGADDDTGRKPSSTRKYQCPRCGMSVRATKVVRIMCVDCMELMQVCK
ncbi:MAG: SprT-like domain-containing protein [Lachnospiraceae bacterium]|nr:SprT-like domain-containing protein [Acetatifactor muris]MCM1223605.1 SprT-like domain-containing protein [Lachnospiraceae bacterium]MCM1558760.1 SprT-like domain-containing protein [Butyrivibrio sp.]